MTPCIKFPAFLQINSCESNKRKKFKVLAIGLYNQTGKEPFQLDLPGCAKLSIKLKGLTLELPDVV